MSWKSSLPSLTAPQKVDGTQQPITALLSSRMTTPSFVSDSVKTVDECCWVECFHKYEAAQKSEPENWRLGKYRTPSMLRASGVSQNNTKRSSSIFVVGHGELTYRYFLNIWFNPGILCTRLACTSCWVSE
jgi:hypothetical protein